MAKSKKLVTRSDFKFYVIGVLSVITAGLVMYFGRDLKLVNNATKGFDA